MDCFEKMDSEAKYEVVFCDILSIFYFMQFYMDFFMRQRLSFHQDFILRQYDPLIAS